MSPVIDNREKRWVSNTVIPKLKKEKFHMQKHEDRFTKGIPDLSFGRSKTNGWIEVKYLEKPMLLDVTFKIDHFTSEQKNWLSRRGKAAGHCWLLIRFEDRVLLIHWSVVRMVGEKPAAWFEGHHMCHSWDINGTETWGYLAGKILER